MKAAFADTFFLAVLNSTDPVHARAAALSREWQARRVTSVWVLTEVPDALARHEHRARFSEPMELLGANPLQ